MTFSVSRHFGVPAEQAWAVLADVGYWPVWGPSVRSAVLSAASLGPDSSGTVGTALGLRLPFRVTSFEPGRYWAWSVAGVAATGHRVTPEAGGCRVTFTVPWWAPAYLAVCCLALRRLARLLAA
ncbi:SRPBCC family protein [Arthrobacter oryzae]|uniref:SRPBCC family protein n=1 Tax=Arthrobacter oryzae TaxID=409290 RepID=A0A3N0C5D4_9MICC|nr:SRPBCC family protein [Arthrobacter oryzae]RNL57450.1 SRPBCC family protein [Arthrobacter oryzae]